MCKSLLSQLPSAPKGKEGWPWTEEVEVLVYDIEKQYPKISIVTPSYNQGGFIEETIRSVLLQNYPNLEYIIIDGRSTDKSVEIIKKYEPWLTYWVSEKDEGQGNAINKGVKKSNGELISWMNSDDFYERGAFSHLCNSLQPDIGLYVGIGHKVDLNRNIMYTPKVENIGLNYFIRWMEGNNFMQPAAFFTKEAFYKAGGIDEQYYFCMDVDLWIKIAHHFGIKKIEHTIAYAYIHENAKTTALVKDMKLETYLMLARNNYLDLAKSGINDMLENDRKSFFKEVLRVSKKIRTRFMQ